MSKDDTYHIGFAIFGSHSRPKPRVRTSVTHPLQIVTITVTGNGGRIGITLCPGKVDPSSPGGAWDRDLSADITVIREWGATTVLSLIEPHEFGLLSVKELPQAVRDAGMVWLHAPIPDVSIPGPAFDAAWKTIGPRLTNDMREGRSVVVHCRGGLGRAGTVAAMLLMMMGRDARPAIDLVREVRPGAIETFEQECYAMNYNIIR